MARFGYDDVVRVSEGSARKKGRKGWVIAIFSDDNRPGMSFAHFAPGVVYTIEFEDGATEEVHEKDLAPWSGEE
jgi:hypothetical protein